MADRGIYLPHIQLFPLVRERASRYSINNVYFQCEVWCDRCTARNRGHSSAQGLIPPDTRTFPGRGWLFKSNYSIRVLVLTENQVVRVSARSCDDTLDAVQCTWFVSILLTIFYIDFYIFFSTLSSMSSWLSSKFDIYLFSSIIRLCASFKTFPSWHIEEWRVIAFRSYWSLQMLAVFSRRWVYRIFLFFLSLFSFHHFTNSERSIDHAPQFTFERDTTYFFHLLSSSFLFFFFSFSLESAALRASFVLYYTDNMLLILICSLQSLFIHHFSLLFFSLCWP